MLHFFHNLLIIVILDTFMVNLLLKHIYMSIVHIMTSRELGRGVEWHGYLHPIQSIYNYLQMSSIMRHN